MELLYQGTDRSEVAIIMHALGFTSLSVVAPGYSRARRLSHSVNGNLGGPLGYESRECELTIG